MSSVKGKTVETVETVVVDRMKGKAQRRVATVVVVDRMEDKAQLRVEVVVADRMKGKAVAMVVDDRMKDKAQRRVATAVVIDRMEGKAVAVVVTDRMKGKAQIRVAVVVACQMNHEGQWRAVVLVEVEETRSKGQGDRQQDSYTSNPRKKRSARGCNCVRLRHRAEVEDRARWQIATCYHFG